MAAGPYIRAGANLPPFSIVDVAPALLHSLGMAIPSNFEGRLRAEIFEPDFLRVHPVRIGEPTLFPDSYALTAGSKTAQPEGDEEIFKQLRALGYME